MLQILNSTERNQAFLKFLLFFLITVSLIVWAVYFNFRMPQKENVMLKSEVDVNRQKEANQLNFSTKLEETMILIDSLDKPNTNINQINLQIDEKIRDLSSLRETHTQTDGKINSYVINQLLTIQKLKKDTRDLSSKASKATDFEAKYNNCQTALDNLRSKNEVAE